MDDKRIQLGDLQQLTMLAVARLGEQAFGSAIQDDLSNISGREVSVSTEPLHSGPARMRIRIALGARHVALVGMVIRRGVVTGLSGTTLGLLGSLWATRLLSSYVFRR